MHTAWMATKTISLRMEAYGKLRAARRYPGESFSEVVMRARWPEETVTAAELLDWYRDEGPLLGSDGLARVESLKQHDQPPEDKWKG